MQTAESDSFEKLKNRSITLKYGSAEYWELRCKLLERAIDQTVVVSERDNCKALYLAMRKKSNGNETIF